MLRPVLSLLLALLYCSNVAASTLEELKLVYIKHLSAPPATLSSHVIPPPDNTQQGVELAIADANTTGKFINQSITLTSFDHPNTGAVLTTLNHQFALGKRYFLLNLNDKSLQASQAWANGKDVLLFNLTNTSDTFRQAQCPVNLLHTSPSNAMHTDALAQWLLHKRLNRVLVVQGKYAGDTAIVNAFTRSAKRFGLKIIAQKQWDFTADLRRSAATEMPLFTQTAKEYDVVFVADAIKDFAEYLPYNTYLPRPVVGSAGVEARSWHHRIEQWGALQLQSRFIKQAKRAMTAQDFQGYVAVRALSTAFFQTKDPNLTSIRRQVLGKDFSFGAYLGRKLSFRLWNGQLRMPITLMQPNAVVSQSPQVGILHPTNELDTLGLDNAQALCQ